MRSFKSTHAVRCISLVAVALAAVGCGTQFAASRADASAAVRVTEHDFAIKADAKQVSAGDVVFKVQNRGPGSHELLVVRESAGRLPFRSDGLTVDEDAVTKAEVGVLEPAHAGAVRELRLRLAPGRYVLFCNMSGHFLGGMHTELVVR